MAYVVVPATKGCVSSVIAKANSLSARQASSIWFNAIKASAASLESIASDAPSIVATRIDLVMISPTVRGMLWL
jgi:hypothetical protein